MAKRFYMEMAQKFPHKTRGPQKKFTDLMHGFKDFVKLVRLDEGSLWPAPAPSRSGVCSSGRRIRARLAGLAAVSPARAAPQASTR